VFEQTEFVPESELADPKLRALFCALYRKQAEAVRAALEDRPDLGAVGPDGLTPLMLAGQLATPELVRLLVDAGADANTQCSHARTPGFATLHMLGVSEHTIWGRHHGGAVDVRASIALLINAGADINLRDERGRSVLDLAYEKNNNALLAALEALELTDAVVRPAFRPFDELSAEMRSLHQTLEFLAEPRARAKARGNPWAERTDVNRDELVDSALATLATDAIVEQIDIRPLHSEHGAWRKESPLIVLAAKAGLPEVTAKLLELGAAPNTRDGRHDCGSALFAAAGAGHAEVVRVLLAAGADLEAEGQKPRGFAETPLGRAAMEGLEPMVQQLLDAGAGPQAALDYLGQFRSGPKGDTKKIRAVLKKAAKPLSSKITAVTTTGSPKRRSLGNDRGVRDFYDSMCKGHPEWITAFVNADIERVRTEIEAAFELRTSATDIAKRPPVSGPNELFAYALQFKKSAWTTLLFELGSFTTPAFDIAEALALHLSRSLAVDCLVFVAEDTSDSMSWSLFRDARVTDRSNLLDEPGDDDNDHDDQWLTKCHESFSQRGIYLPQCSFEQSGSEVVLAIEGFSLAALRCVDCYVFA